MTELMMRCRICVFLSLYGVRSLPHQLSQSPRTRLHTQTQIQIIHTHIY